MTWQQQIETSKETRTLDGTNIISITFKNGVSVQYYMTYKTIIDDEKWLYEFRNTGFNLSIKWKGNVKNMHLDNDILLFSQLEKWSNVKEA